MRKPAWLRRSGPYKCSSLGNGHITVKPSWPQYGTVWNGEDGGGPGMLGRLTLVDDLERYLNNCYSEDEIREAEQRIAEHDRNLAEIVTPTDTARALQIVGSIGGKARAAKLTSERRREIAKIGAAKRWGEDQGRVLRPDDELPSRASLCGSDPNFTGDILDAEVQQ